jgi:uncharacterized protein
MQPQEVLEAYIAAAQRGDWDTAYGIFADDVVFHIPGRSSWAGHHRGRDRAIAYIENAREIAHAGKVEVELEAMLVGEDRVGLMVRERFDRPDGAIEILRTNVYRVEGDRIVEIWIFEQNQHEVDELLA